MHSGPWDALSDTAPLHSWNRSCKDSEKDISVTMSQSVGKYHVVQVKNKGNNHCLQQKELSGKSL